MRTATVHTETTGLAGPGTGIRLEPGTYDIVEIDGAAARGVAYIDTSDGLVCIDADDPNITIVEA